MSAVADINNYQLPRQLFRSPTSSEQLKPAASQWILLFQEDLIEPVLKTNLEQGPALAIWPSER
jgi:hypothetical protein